MRALLPMVALALPGITSGCSPADDFATRFPGQAAVMDNLTAAPNAQPGVYNDYTLEIVGIDDGPVQRYVPPALSGDAYPEALVKAGTHHFIVESKPIVRPPGFKVKRLEFTGSVAAGKKYLLTDQKGFPELVPDPAR